MPPQNRLPYSALNDPNSIWGPNFLPKVAASAPSIIGAVGDFGRMVTNTINPFPAIRNLQGAVSGTPLMGGRTMVDATASTLPQFPSGTVASGADIYPTVPQMKPSMPPATVGSGQTISTRDAIAANNANMTDYEKRAFGFFGLSPSSQGIVQAVSSGQPEGLLGGSMNPATQPSIDQAIASARFSGTSTAQSPVAPVRIDNINQPTERKGVQTAYGMIYPEAGQEAGAQKSAAMGPMGARLANVRQELNQQEKIAQMRERGAQLARERVSNQEQFFAAKRAERKDVNEAMRGAIASGATPQQARQMAAQYTQAQPSSIAGIQREAANYQNVGFNNMTDFSKQQIASLFKQPTQGNAAPTAIASNQSIFNSTPFGQGLARMSVFGGGFGTTENRINQMAFSPFAAGGNLVAQGNTGGVMTNLPAFGGTAATNLPAMGGAPSDYFAGTFGSTGRRMVARPNTSRTRLL